MVKSKYFRKSRFAGKGFHNFTSTSLLPRHRWYYLKEGFSASLVEEAIKASATRPGEKLHILEPFCGTGTTPLTAALTGHSCTAIEVNPFLAFTSRVKTTTGRWRESQFTRNLEEVLRSGSRSKRSSLEGFSTFTKSGNLDKWLFNSDVLSRFESLKEAINRSGRTYRDAMMLSAIVATYACCNAKRDGKALRYKTTWKELNYSARDLMKQFQNHSMKIVEDILELPIDHSVRPRIIIGDSRTELSKLEEDRFDLVVTSPPYLNSADYSDVYRPELFLGGHVKNNDELRRLRLATVRSHIQVKWPEKMSFESPLLDPIIETLSKSDSLWDQRIPRMVQAYFDDMWKIFRLMKPKLRTNALVWMVVSTSAYGGVQIPVDFIVADAANQAGYTLIGIHRLRDLRAAGQQWKRLNIKAPPLRESLIIMQNR